MIAVENSRAIAFQQGFAPPLAAVDQLGRPAGRMPHLGYDRPGFSSPAAPDEGSARGTRPSYSSPDYSSPDFGGPEHQPE